MLSLVTDFRNSRQFSACKRKPSNSARMLLGLYARSQMSLFLAVSLVLHVLTLLKTPLDIFAGVTMAGKGHAMQCRLPCRKAQPCQVLPVAWLKCM